MSGTQPLLHHDQGEASMSLSGPEVLILLAVVLLLFGSSWR